MGHFFGILLEEMTYGTSYDDLRDAINGFGRTTAVADNEDLTAQCIC